MKHRTAAPPPPPESRVRAGTLRVAVAAALAALVLSSAVRLRRAAASPRAHAALGPDGLASSSSASASARRLRLPEPEECRDWRRRARHPERLWLYRRHFTSHDLTDWFVYASFFTELWHASLRRGERPRYLDIAANHARLWSGTWFLDRCMGWDGVCVEANPKYWRELSHERTCRLVRNCVSDRRRDVMFSLTDAYGGVVARDGLRGVNASHHRTAKFAQQHTGVRRMTCARTADVARGEFAFLSLDVEGHELNVLRGVDWARTRFGVIVTENKSRDVRDLLRRRGYSLREGVLRDDIWIRDGSGFAIDHTVRNWLRGFDTLNYTFRAGVRGDSRGG